MIYGIASWEKLSKFIYRKGNSITMLHPTFFTSPSSPAIGNALMLSGIGILGLFFWIDGFSVSKIMQNITPIVPILLIQSIIGAWIFIRSSANITLRNAQGGIHPTDTLIVFDGAKQEVFKQQGTGEEYLAKLTEIKFIIKEAGGEHGIDYKIIATFPTGKQEKLNSFTKSVDAQAFLEKISDILQVT